MILLCPAALFAGVLVVVDEDTPNGWFFYDDQAEMPLPNDFVLGPDTPPSGTGSAHLAVANASEGVLIGTQNHAATALVTLAALTYSTYQSITPQAIALQFNVDYDNTDSTTATWQGRLVFEPYLGSGTVLTGTWQSWDALAASARWWSTGTPIVGDAPQAAVCTQGSPCSWATILSTYPNAGIQSGALAGIVFKAGSGWPAFDGNVDDFHISTIARGPGFDVIYDFETNVPVELQRFTVE
jgi:hypothetical protein